MSETIDGYPVVCMSDFFSMGYQPGEKGVTWVRLLSTLVSVSIISSWCNKKAVRRYMLFFVHYLSGLFHQLAQMALAEMVSLCWTKSSMLRAIQALKFVELVGGNLLAITNVAICVNLAIIVWSHHTMSRVKNVSSPRMILGFVMVAVAAAVAGACFWETVSLSGTLFWSVNLDQGKHNWVLTSIYFMELIAGVAMLTIGTLLVLFRWPELCQVWQLHRRIKCYIVLSVVATVVDLAIGIGGVVYVVYEPATTLIVATWTMRHIHICLDTLVLYSALGVTARHDRGDRGDRVVNEQGAPAQRGKDGNSGYHSGSFHHPRQHQHQQQQQQQQHQHSEVRGPMPPLRVAADGWGHGVNVTSSSSPDYVPEDAA